MLDEDGIIRLFFVLLTLSGTRREEQLYDDRTYRAVITMRCMFSQLADPQGLEAMEAFMQQMAKTDSNAEFLATLSRGMK